VNTGDTDEPIMVVMKSEKTEDRQTSPMKTN